MPNIIDITNKRLNKLGYDHVCCASCNENLFYVSTNDEGEGPYFYSLICKNCNNEIFINLTPVWPNQNKEK